jgi:SAM-dependent methyltransferase
MAAMKVTVTDNLSEMYGDYYHGESLDAKRGIAARDSVDHIRALHSQPLGKLVDIGAGNGAVLGEIARRHLATEAAALEISATGIDGIRARNLPILKDVRQFDGYQIPFEDNTFDTAVASTF